MTDKEWMVEKQYFGSVASGITGKAVVVADAMGGELGYTAKGNVIHVAKEHMLYEKLRKASTELQAATEATLLRFGITVHEALHQVFTNFDYISELEKRLVRRGILKTTLDLEAYHTIVNLIEDPAIENMAAEIIGGPALRALDFTITKLYELSEDFDYGCQYPFDEVINALIQFGDLGIVHGTFHFQSAEIVFRLITPLFYRAINEPDCKKRVDMAAPIFAECARLWAGRTESEKRSMLAEHRKNMDAHGKSPQSHNAQGQGSNGTMNEHSKKNDRRKAAMEKQEAKADGKPGQSEGSGTNELSKGQGPSSQTEHKNNEIGKDQTESDSSSINKDDSENTNGEKPQNKTGDKEEKHGANQEMLPKPELTQQDVDAILSHILEHMYDAELKSKENESYYRPFECFDDIESNVDFQKVEVENQYVDEVPAEKSHHYDAIVDQMQEGISSVVQQLREIFIADRVRKVYSESGRASLKRFASGKVTTRLFERKRKPGHKEDMCVAIVGDCSGSMQSGGKITQAKYTMIALAEIFSEFDIPFYFIGFHVPFRNPVQRHYIRWNNTRSERERLLLLSADGSNFDSYSIRYVTNLLKERQERHKLLVVLSDGLPSFYFSHEEGIKQNTLAINAARADQIDVLGIGVGEVNTKTFCQMYQREYFLNVQQPSDLFSKLAERMTAVVEGWD